MVPARCVFHRRVLISAALVLDVNSRSCSPSAGQDRASEAKVSKRQCGLSVKRRRPGPMHAAQCVAREQGTSCCMLAEVRDAQPEDLHSLLHLVKECMLQWKKADLQNELSRELGKVLVATIDGTICGAIIAWLVADEVQILELAVLPDCRRQGLGTLLLMALLASRQNGTAWLEVSSNNEAAVQLYEKIGFVQRAVRKGYYSNGEDAAVLAKDLAAHCPNPRNKH